MFGCVEKQPQNIAGEVGSAHRTRREEVLLQHLFQPAYSVFNGHVDEDKQLFGRGRRRARVLLSTQCGKLLIPDRLTTGTGEESVHAPANVSKMEPDRRGAAWSLPQLARR
jgi:hypothetical protein